MDEVKRAKRAYRTRDRMVEEAAGRMFHGGQSPPADPTAVAEWIARQARQSALDLAEVARRLLDRKSQAEQLLGELLIHAAGLAIDAMNRGDCERLAAGVAAVTAVTGKIQE